jgi:hypothetical protein
MIKRNDLLIGPKEKAITAVKEGRKDEAIRYIEELYLEFRPLHDRYGDWILSLLGFVKEKLGEEAVEKALKKTFEDVYKERAIATAKLSYEERIRRYCQSHRAHYSEFYVEEDDEKTTIVIPYCGSGGRIQEGGKVIDKSTQKAYPWSFNQSGVNYYCCHEAVFNQAYKDLGLDFVTYEYGKQYNEDGTPQGCSCRWIFYKNR